MKGIGGGRPYTYDVMEMLELRAKGMSYSALGKKYGKDHTTIMHSCKKFGVFPDVPPKEKTLTALTYATYIEHKDPITQPIEEVAPIQDKYAYLFDEPVNEGKTYEQYCEDAKKRPLEKRWFEDHKEPNWTLEASLVKEDPDF